MADVPLREHFEALLRELDVRMEQRFKAQEGAVAAALAAAKEAVTVAEANARDWRQGANEWRGAMTDRERDLFSRREGEALDRQLRDVTDRLNRGEGTVTGGQEASANAARSLGLQIASAAVFVSLVGVLIAVLVR